MVSLNPTEELLWRYPQLSLEPRDDLKSTDMYKDIVLKGNLDIEIQNPFIADERDEKMLIETPIGNLEVFYIANRKDFERIIQILCWRNAKIVPPSMGAVSAFGVINWRKIQKHKKEFLSNNGFNWELEFKTFTKNPSNFKDKLIVVTHGFYSNLSPEQTNFSDNTWEKVSLDIRIYHELTHVISKTLFPKNQNIFRDEVLADFVGIVKAINDYDVNLAKKFLGIEKDHYSKGGRLENYVSERENIQDISQKATLLIDTFKKTYQKQKNKSAFEMLIYIEKNQIGLNKVVFP